MTVPLIGLTGGMGAGKSTALAALGRLGAETLSSDAIVHELYGDPRVRDAVVERFGAQVAPGGTVDRHEIARIVFAEPEHREWLERLLWPLVGERIAAWGREISEREAAPRAAVLEVPLLFESGMEGGFEATIALVAPESLIAERTAERGLVGVGERGSRQMSQEQKAERATFVVSNEGSIEDLERELSLILDKLGR